jgi:hypothetical protein
MDRSWMYDRTFPRRKGLKRRFTDGVEEFLNIVRVSPMVLLEGGIICLMTGISMVFLVLLLVVK